MKRYFIAMAGGLLGLVLLSYFRLYYIGTPALDGLPMNLPWEIIRRTLIFSFMALIGWGFLKIYFSIGEEINLKKLFVASLILQVLAFISLPLTTNDIFSYLAFGKMTMLGIDVAKNGVSALPAGDIFASLTSPRWTEMPMVYGPIIGWINKVTVFPENLWLSVFANKLAILLCSFGVTALVYYYCKRFKTGASAGKAFVLFALNPVFIWEFAGQAHNDVTMIFFVVVFVIFATKKIESLAFLGLLVSLLTKMAMLPALGLYYTYLFFTAKKKFALITAVILVGTFLFTSLFADKLLFVLATPSSGGIDATRLTGTPLFLIHKYFGEGTYKVFWIASMLFMTGLGIRYTFKCKTLDGLFLSSALFIMLFNFIASPMYQPWYITWIFPFLMAVEDDRLKNFVAVFSVVSVAQYAILNSTTGAIINILALIGFCWFYFGKRPALGQPTS